MRHIPPRFICATGFLLFATGSFLSGSLNPDFAGDQFIAIQILRAMGQPLVLVPLSIIATAMIPPSQAGSASSLYNILRNLGGAMGIAMLATVLDSRAAYYFDILRSHVTPGNPAAAERLTLLTEHLGSAEAALRLLDGQVRQQAQIMAYNDAFHAIAVMLGFSLLCIIMPRRLPLLTELLGGATPPQRLLDGQLRQRAQIMAYNAAFHAIAIMLGFSLLSIIMTRGLPKAARCSAPRDGACTSTFPCPVALGACARHSRQPCPALASGAAGRPAGPCRQ